MVSMNAENSMSEVLYTVGHGTLEQQAFVELLREVGIHDVVDIRSYPGSRHNPQFGREEMESWVPEAGLAYTWMRDLGGRRKPVPGSRHVALRHPSFRSYADHMETPEFVAGVDTLLQGGDAQVIMCSESVWWRCHRRLVSDYVTLVRQVAVKHLMHDGRLMEHKATDRVRRVGDRLVYDGGAESALSVVVFGDDPSAVGEPAGLDQRSPRSDPL
jgi:uncharacterized protein (DUF488 family)